MNHLFNVEEAEKYGMLEAVLLSNIRFWVAENAANERNCFEGRYWTYNSVSAYQKLFPYASDGQIRRAIKHLVDEGVLIVGNFSEDRRDRTLWYTIANFKNDGMHLSNLKNASSEGEKSLNNNNNNSNYCTDINTNISSDESESKEKPEAELKREFEIIYGIYPKKVGKADAYRLYKQWVSKKGKEIDKHRYKLTREQVYYAVQKYVDEANEQGREIKYFKDFDTLMGRKLLNYVEFDE